MPSTPNPDNDPRKHVQLASELRRQIANGTLRPGEPVPSIGTLAGSRGWSRGPCIKALHTLEAEGLLRRTPGLGYYVI